MPKGNSVLLTALITLLYLCHLFGWLIFMVAWTVYAACALRARKWTRLIYLVSAVAPSCLMLLWYISNRYGTKSSELYDSLLNKTVSLVSPLLLFLRTDPFEPMLPMLWLNLLALSAIVVVILLTLRAPIFRHAHLPTLATGSILAGLALVIPFSWFGGLLRPDERFTLPALLVLLAAFPYKRLTIGTSLSVVSIALFVLGFHIAEYDRGSRLLSGIHTVTSKTISSDGPALALAVHEPPIRGACTLKPGDVSLGVPVLQWFGLYRLIETNKLRVNMFDTSLVQARANVQGDLDLHVQEQRAASATPSTILGSEVPSRYAVIEIFGCDHNTAVVSNALRSQYVTVASGPGFELLRRRE